MNRTKYKTLKNKVKRIQVQWLKSIMPDDSNTDINIDNVDTYIPDEKYVMSAGTRYLSYMTDRWLINKLKKYPHVNNYNEIEEILNGTK